jgi:NADH-quinone oxidoreductase subunit M
MREMGGLWQYMPRMGAVALFFALASLGMPGLGNFVAEFLVLLGLFKIDPWMTAAAALGLITAAIYSLIMMQKAFYGKPNTEHKLTDFGSLEMTAMGVMIIALIWLGVYPQPVLDLVQPVLDSLYQHVPELGDTEIVGLRVEDLP